VDRVSQASWLDDKIRLKTDDSHGVCPNRSSPFRLAVQQYTAHIRATKHGRSLANLGGLPDIATTSGFKWQNSSNGVHSWLVFDYHVSSANATALATKYDFIWGSSPQNAPAWRKGSESIIVSRYINGNRDATFNAGNLTWWRIHHPSWVMWTCKNSTGQRNVAWSDGDIVVPLDWSSPDVVKYQIDAYTCGCYVCPCSPGDPGGYNAIAVDGYVNTSLPFEFINCTAQRLLLNRTKPTTFGHTSAILLCDVIYLWCLRLFMQIPYGEFRARMWPL
jgi:hypothetical protein